MKIPPIVWPLAGLAVVAAFGVGAGGRSDGPPAVADVARFAGCDAPAIHPATSEVRESATCREGGYDVEAVTFVDNAQRDRWVDNQKVRVVTPGLLGVGTPLAMVAGDRWAVVTADPDAVAWLEAAGGGWWV